jgi:phosphatidylserine/phosphatidylglycerophosphate/cardiolipin synthase-like enzyme
MKAGVGVAAPARGPAPSRRGVRRVTAARGRRVFAVACVLAALAAPGVAAREAAPAPGATIEALFTPGDAIDARLAALIEGARAEVLVSAFSFTSRPLARALLAAHRRGVRVEIVADRAQTLELPGSVVPGLARDGVAVWLDGNYAAAHNKVLVVDADGADAAIATGSYNYTSAAQRRNAENVLIVRHDSSLAARYRANFARLRERARRYDGWAR